MIFFKGTTTVTNLACSKFDISRTLVHSSYIVSYLAISWDIHVGLPLEGHPCSSTEVHSYFALIGFYLCTNYKPTKHFNLLVQEFRLLELLKDFNHACAKLPFHTERPIL
jgi:hypothetical protein